MITLLGKRSRFCDGITRRSCLKAGVLGTAGLTLADVLRLRACNPFEAVSDPNLAEFYVPNLSKTLSIERLEDRRSLLTALDVHPLVVDLNRASDAFDKDTGKTPWGRACCWLGAWWKPVSPACRTGVTKQTPVRHIGRDHLRGEVDLLASLVDVASVG